MAMISDCTPIHQLEKDDKDVDMLLANTSVLAQFHGATVQPELVPHGLL